MRILVDHLTRMDAGYICVAGIDTGGEHVRPVLDGHRLRSELLLRNGGPFELAAMVELGSLRPVGSTPATEDQVFDPRQTVLIGDPDVDLLWTKLEENSELSLVDIFGQDLEKRGKKKAVVPEGRGRRSLGTLSPGYQPRLRVRDDRLSMALYDPQFDELELRVTDFRFFAESNGAWVLNRDLVNEFDESLRSGRRCVLSVGLTRPFSGSETEPVHWLQVNNIHFEPDGFEGRSSTMDAKETQPVPAIPEVEDGSEPTSEVSGTPRGDSIEQAGSLAPRSNMWPSRLPDSTPRSESKVWHALGTLEAAWHVFHGVQWQALRQGAQGDGEADFVLVHPDHGLLILEVKGGGLRIENGVWYTESGDGLHKINPVEQAQSSKRALLTYLKETIDGLPWLPIGHAVWFPDVLVTDRLGPAAPKEIVLDRDDLDHPEEALDSVIEHWDLSGSLTPTHMESIRRRLAPSHEIRITIADRIRDAEEQLVRLTEAQARALDGLRNARRVLVIGGAGTGKTVLATEKARLLSSEGYRVALTCFNRPLGLHLEGIFAGNNLVDAGPFHRQARQWALAGGLSWPDDPSPAWWEDAAAELVLEAASHPANLYDAVIVDEGQDFAASWFLALEGLLRDSEASQMVVFADKLQAIYRQSWEPPFGAVRYDLDRNVRNTLPIATVVTRLSDERPPAEGSDGPPVEFVARDPSENLSKVVGRAVHRLVREESVEPKALVVLTQSKDDREELLGETLAGVPTTDLDTPGRGLVVETIHRFKGLESDAAIVVLNKLDTAHDRAVGYIGISRAKAHLVIVGPTRLQTVLGIS